MSYWLYRKGKDGKTYTYSVTVPIEMIIIIIAIIVCHLVPRYINNSVQVGKDSLTLCLIGFTLFTVSKISLFRRGIRNSWGTDQMNNTFRWLYKAGYTFMIIGLAGSILNYAI